MWGFCWNGFLEHGCRWSGNLAAIKVFDEVQNKFEPLITLIFVMGCDVAAPPSRAYPALSLRSCAPLSRAKGAYAYTEEHDDGEGTGGGVSRNASTGGAPPSRSDTAGDALSRMYNFNPFN